MSGGKEFSVGKSASEKSSSKAKLDQFQKLLADLHIYEESSTSATDTQLTNRNEWLEEDVIKEPNESDEDYHKRRTYEKVQRALETYHEQLIGPSQSTKHRRKKLPKSSSIAQSRTDSHNKWIRIKEQFMASRVDCLEHFTGSDEECDEDYRKSCIEDAMVELSMMELEHHIKDLEKTNKELEKKDRAFHEVSFALAKDYYKLRDKICPLNPESPVVDAFARSTLLSQRGEIIDRNQKIHNKERKVAELQELAKSQALTIAQLTEKVLSMEKELQQMRDAPSDVVVSKN